MNKQRLLMGKVDNWKEQKCDINRDREAKKKKTINHGTLH